MSDVIVVQADFEISQLAIYSNVSALLIQVTNTYSFYVDN